MNYINYKGTKIHLDNRIQTGSKGREFQARVAQKDVSKAPVYLTKRGECYHWIFTFRYLDNMSEGFRIFINPYDDYNGIEHFNE